MGTEPSLIGNDVPAAIAVWWVNQPFGDDTGAAFIDSAEHDFAVHVLHSSSGPVVACSGELDLHEVELLTRALNDALVTVPPALVIDLSALDFIDSSGLNALLRARTRAERQGTALHLADPSPPVVRLLELTCTDKVFTVDPNPRPHPAR